MLATALSLLLVNAIFAAPPFAFALLCLFTFPILFALFFEGVFWGGFFCIIATVVSLFFSLRETDVHLLSPLLVVGLAFALSRSAYLRMLDRGRKLEVVFERLEWEGNLLEASEKKGPLQSPPLEEKLKRYLSLSQIAQFLNETLSLNEVALHCVRRAKSLIGPSQGAFLFLVEEGTQEPSLVASEILDDSFKMRSKQGDLFVHWVLKNRRPLLVEDTRHDFRFDLSQLQDRPVRSLMMAPLFSGRRLSGVLRLESAGMNSYGADDLRFFSILADLASVSLENARLYSRTEELARVDELTGLFVHRYFKERLQEELIRAQRTQRPLSLLMIDIDHFKRYNDQYGHIAGDLVLKQVAQILKKDTQEGELVCRYGGEEFAIILPERPKPEAVVFAQTLCQAVAETDFLLRREMTRVTLSIGVATSPQDGLFQEDLLKRVDTLLYEAKRLGRNRVCSS